MRSGVRSRPSRPGSSPRRTIISRNSSWKVAPVKLTGSSSLFMVSLSSPDLRTAAVLKRIHHGFFQPYLLDRGGAEAARQHTIDLRAQVLGGRHQALEGLQVVEILVPEALQHFAPDE